MSINTICVALSWNQRFLSNSLSQWAFMVLTWAISLSNEIQRPILCWQERQKACGYDYSLNKEDLKQDCQETLYGKGGREVTDSKMPMIEDKDMKWDLGS